MPGTKRSQVFLCHASEDKSAARKLYNRLKKDGIDAWLDEQELLPGQDWQLEISKAVKASDAIIVFLSSQSVRKAGFVQKEIKLALDVAKEKPEGTIYFIPARLDDCLVPDSLQNYQWVNLFDNKGYERLLKALKTRLNFPETGNVKSALAQVIITLERDFRNFKKKDKDSLISAIAKLTGVSPDQIRILQVAEGSVIITLEMPEIGVKRLFASIRKKNPEITRLRIIRIDRKMREGIKVLRLPIPLDASLFPFDDTEDLENE